MKTVIGITAAGAEVVASFDCIPKGWRARRVVFSHMMSDAGGEGSCAIGVRVGRVPCESGASYALLASISKRAGGDLTTDPQADFNMRLTFTTTVQQTRVVAGYAEVFVQAFAGEFVAILVDPGAMTIRGVASLEMVRDE